MHPVVAALQSALASAQDNLPDMMDSPPEVVASCCLDIAALTALLRPDGGQPAILAYL